MDKIKLYKTIIPLNVVSDTTLTLCIGEDSYKQYCKKIKVSPREDIDTYYGCFLWFPNSDIKHTVIYLRLKEENRSLLSYKSTLVHEINHAVTHIFNTYDFNCDELRSYLMQDIYFDFIDYIDTLNDKGLL